jgi:hypothetical protein
MNYNELLTGIITLPLTLNNFSGIADNCTAKLNWLTTNEVNVQQYVVEKSTNGANFIPVHATPAKCNMATNTLCNYQAQLPMQDAAAYFRLKMVDADGKYSYSEVVRLVNNCAASNTFRVSVSPNPVSKAVVVNFSQAITESADLEMIDMNGKAVLQQKIARNSVSVNLVLPNTIAAGQYIIKVRTATSVAQAKVVVM